MQTDLECLACFMRQALATARLCTSDNTVQRQVVTETMKLLPQLDCTLSPPENAVAVYGLIASLTRNADPYFQLKAESNELALSQQQEVRRQINVADDPLELAVRYSIAGNIIDYGTGHSVDVHRALKASIQEELSVNDFDLFARELRETSGKTILFLADNCGEIVFDGLLAEQLQQLGHEVTLVVREREIVNDATVKTIEETGLNGLCRVIANGCGCPGTPLHSCSEELRAAYDQADIIVSKGQGNFETLSEAEGNITFLLRVKCPVVARHICELYPLGAGSLAGSGEPVLMKRRS